MYNSERNAEPKVVRPPKIPYEKRNPRPLQWIGPVCFGVDPGEKHFLTLASTQGHTTRIKNRKVIYYKLQIAEHLKHLHRLERDLEITYTEATQNAIHDSKKALRSLEFLARREIKKSVDEAKKWIIQEASPFVINAKQARSTVYFGVNAHHREFSRFDEILHQVLIESFMNIPITLVFQDEKYTTSQCPLCHRYSRATKDWFECKCGFKMNRDEKAAFAILSLGLIQKISFFHFMKNPS